MGWDEMEWERRKKRGKESKRERINRSGMENDKRTEREREKKKEQG